MDKELAAFRQGLRKIDEGGLNRIMSHGKYGFIIISANRSEIYSDYPKNDLTPQYEEWCEREGKDIFSKENMDFWLKQRNKTEDKRLLSDLMSSEYAYTPVFGGYKGKDNVTDNFEPSYIVYCHAKEDSNAYLNFQKLLEFGLSLVRKYKQDSVYVQKPNNEPPIYLDGEGNKVNSKESNDFKFNRYTEKYFTIDKRKKRITNDYPDETGKGRLESMPQRFTADIQFESLYRKAAPSTYFNRMKRSKVGEVFID